MVTTSLDYEANGQCIVIFERDDVEVLRMPIDEAVGMAYTVIGLAEDASHG